MEPHHPFMAFITSYYFKYIILLPVAILAFVLRDTLAWPLNLDAFHTLSGLDAYRQTTTDLATKSGWKRDVATTYFTTQFKSPHSILSVLFLVGGDIVKKAIAQMPGGRYTGRFTLTPAVFSFGWVSYAVGSLSSALGDGICLPPPENAGSVVNVGDFSSNGSRPLVGSGDRRENRSWVIGRLMRDLEISVERLKQKENPELLKTSLLVSVYQLEGASKSKEGYEALVPKRDLLWWMFIPAIIVQLAIAAIPLMLSKVDKNWAILFVTVTGNVLALLTASLSSMHEAEFRKSRSRQTYALTRGNGHKHVFLILPDTTEQSEVGEGNETRPEAMSSLPYLEDMASNRYTRPGRLTRSTMHVLAFLWVLLLLTIAGLQQDTWYLFGSGTIGMVVNVFLADSPRDPAAYGIPLVRVKGQKGEFGFPRPIPGATRMQKMGVRDTLMELEEYYPGAGHALKSVFFTGLPNERDKAWTTQDKVRLETAQERLDHKWETRNAPDSGRSGQDKDCWNPSEDWLSKKAVDDESSDTPAGRVENRKVEKENVK